MPPSEPSPAKESILMAQSSAALPPAPAKVLTAWLSYVILIGGLLTPVLSLYITIVSYTPAPYVDQWTFFDDVAIHHGHYGLGLLWRQHNEHRMPLPKLFYLADLFFFHGTNVFLLLVAYLIQAAHLYLFGWLFRRLAGFSGALWRTAFGVAAFCLFAPTQVENFIFGWQIALLLPLLAATVGCTAVALYAEPPSGADPAPRHGRYLTGAAAAYLVAALSAANGLILWPMLIFAAFALRLPKKVHLIIAWLGLSLTALYLSGLHSGEAPAAASLNQFVQYISAYFSNSWSALSLDFGALLTALAVTVAFVESALLLRKRGDRFVVVLCTLMLFDIVTSFITAAGRLRFGVEQAYVARYQSTAWLFWCCFLCLVLWYVWTTVRWYWLPVFQAAFGMVLLMNSLTVPQLLRDAHARAAGLKQGTFALRMGVSDGDATRFLNPFFPARWLLSLAQYLRVNGESVYAAESASPLGRQFQRFYSLVPGDRCLGHVDSIKVIPDPIWSGIRVSGWAFDLQAGKPALLALLVSKDGRVVGMAETGFERADVATAIAAVRRIDTGFSGYVPADLETSEANAFAILSDGVSACPLDNGTSLRFDLPPPPPAIPGLTPGVTARMRNEVRRTAADSPRGDGFDPPAGDVDRIGKELLQRRTSVTLPDKADVLISGWAVDQVSRSPAGGVEIVIDEIPYRARYGFDRPDVAQTLGVDAYRKSGFELLVPVSGLASGNHSFAVRVISSNHDDVYWEMPAISVLVP